MSCSSCFQGNVHDGQPRGRITQLHGLDTYISETSDGKPTKGIIVIIPDAFGWQFVNNRILADHYAEKSEYKVYLPDFMNGHAAPVSMLESIQAFAAPGNYLSKPYHLFRAIRDFIPFNSHNKIEKTFPVVKSFFEKLRKEEGNALLIGAAGFCWGGKHTVLLAQGDEKSERLIDAGFTGHPSFLDIPGDIEKVAVTVSFAIGAKDTQVSPGQAEKIRANVEAKPESARGEVRIYENACHGFCVRADLKFKDVARQADEAEDQCIAWFNARFSHGASGQLRSSHVGV